MAKSLQEQLLAAGLTDEKKARQIREEQRKAKKQQKQKKTASTESDERRQRAQQAQAEKAARDREINRQRQLDAERKALQAQVRQMVEQHRVARRDGDIAYNFVLDKKVKKIYVSKELCDQLARGRLAIVELDADYHLLPSQVADKIRQRDSHIPIAQAQPSSQQPDEDDPYAEFQVPDDLMW
ncbi:DUF2058 domain-containing protein [Mangrovitalea sediminis]|uniref:DUF2058 domain-containing protein n=1 Tax=Mangrovitalea sediminis TaxID=1982043 RepID=UPI000BE58559|nr:DUF2058 domain-containing protein [Mangrovitalea sediminis]